MLSKGRQFVVIRVRVLSICNFVYVMCKNESRETILVKVKYDFEPLSKTAKIFICIFFFTLLSLSDLAVRLIFLVFFLIAPKKLKEIYLVDYQHLRYVYLIIIRKLIIFAQKKIFSDLITSLRSHGNYGLLPHRL